MYSIHVLYMQQSQFESNPLLPFNLKLMDNLCWVQPNQQIHAEGLGIVSIFAKYASRVPSNPIPTLMVFKHIRHLQ